MSSRTRTTAMTAPGWVIARRSSSISNLICKAGHFEGMSPCQRLLWIVASLCRFRVPVQLRALAAAQMARPSDAIPDHCAKDEGADEPQPQRRGRDVSQKHAD